MLFSVLSMYCLKLNFMLLVVMGLLFWNFMFWCSVKVYDSLLGVIVYFLVRLGCNLLFMLCVMSVLNMLYVEYRLVLVWIWFGLSCSGSLLMLMMSLFLFFIVVVVVDVFVDVEVVGVEVLDVDVVGFVVFDVGLVVVVFVPELLLYVANNMILVNVILS